MSFGEIMIKDGSVVVQFGIISKLSANLENI